MEPRPAATIVLVRDAQEGPQLLLVQRLATAVFGPGSWVFPGGVLEACDVELKQLYPELAGRLAERMDLSPDAAVGYLCAAVRETLEETGILVGSSSLAGTVRHDEIIHSLRTLLEQLTHLPYLDDVIYLSRWITPPGFPRRYDTRFFLAQVGDRLEPVLSPLELAACRWIRPSDALERYAAGELVMMPPTVHTLKTLAGYASVEMMLRDLRERPPESYLPELPAELHP